MMKPSGQGLVGTVGSSITGGMRGVKASVGAGVPIRLVSMATSASISDSLGPGEEGSMGDVEIMMDGMRGADEGCGLAMVGIARR